MKCGHSLINRYQLLKLKCCFLCKHFSCATCDEYDSVHNCDYSAPDGDVHWVCDNCAPSDSDSDNK